MIDCVANMSRLLVGTVKSTSLPHIVVTFLVVDSTPGGRVFGRIRVVPFDFFREREPFTGRPSRVLLYLILLLLLATSRKRKLKGEKKQKETQSLMR